MAGNTGSSFNATNNILGIFSPDSQSSLSKVGRALKTKESQTKNVNFTKINDIINTVTTAVKGGVEIFGSVMDIFNRKKVIENNSSELVPEGYESKEQILKSDKTFIYVAVAGVGVIVLVLILTRKKR